MSGKSILIGLAVVVLIVGGVLFFTKRSVKSLLPQRASQTQKLNDEIKSPHFVDSSPMHGELFVTSPIGVVVNTNFTLSTGSTIFIEKDGKDVGKGTSTIDETKLTLRRALQNSLPDGIYTVKYKACWPDGSCHDGQFQFIIDSSKKSEYQNLKGKKQVTISMKNLTFNPAKIIVSPETVVIWKNDETPIHFVNTDPHPSHTLYFPQNSREIKQGEMYSVVFKDSGEYGYHCSAHISSGMTGRIVVE